MSSTHHKSDDSGVYVSNKKRGSKTLGKSTHHKSGSKKSHNHHKRHPKQGSKRRVSKKIIIKSKPKITNTIEPSMIYPMPKTVMIPNQCLEPPAYYVEPNQPPPYDFKTEPSSNVFSKFFKLVKKLKL